MPHLHEPEPQQDRHYFSRLEYRDIAHRSSYNDRLDPHELGIHLGLTVFEKHLQDLSKIRVQFVEARSLRMRAGEPRHVADE